MYGTLSRSGLFIATSAGAVALSATMSHAGGMNLLWINPFGGSFHAARNWEPLGVPGPPDTAIFSLDDLYTVTFSQSTATQTVILDEGQVTIELAGSTFALNGAVIGDHIENIGQLTLLAGTLNVQSADPAFVRIGKDVGANGELIVSTGADFISTEIVIIGDAGSGSLLVLNGGTVLTDLTFLADEQ